MELSQWIMIGTMTMRSISRSILADEITYSASVIVFLSDVNSEPTIQSFFSNTVVILSCSRRWEQKYRAGNVRAIVKHYNKPKQKRMSTSERKDALEKISCGKP